MYGGGSPTYAMQFHIACFSIIMCMTVILYFGIPIELAYILFLDLLCIVSCCGQSTTFAHLITFVFVHIICIGSNVKIICPEPNLL